MLVRRAPRPAGDTLKLRETPKAPITKPASERRPVARLAASGTVTALGMRQWTIRIQAPKGSARSPRGRFRD